MKKLAFFLGVFLISLTTMAQQTIFPAQHLAPEKFNTGTVHISVVSHSEHSFSKRAAATRGITTPTPPKY